MNRPLLCAAACCGLLASLAHGEDAPDKEAARDAQDASALVTKYLQAVKAKKWADAKKLVHPKTLDAIAERKKRLGKEDHPMSPQTYEKTEYYLKDFKVTGTKPGPRGTFIVDTSEDDYQVEEKGISEGDVASYLVCKSQGKPWVVDKKRGGEAFTQDSVKYGYKGYCDPVPAPTHDEEE